MRAGHAQEAVGFVVAYELLLDRIERQLAVQDPGQGGRVAGDVEKCLSGRGVPASAEEAARWFRKAADQGLALAR